MGSTNFTEHYEIPLPLGSDKTTPMDYNTSMEAVDTALFTAVGNASSAVSGLETANANIATNAENISSLAGRVTTAEGTLVTQGQAINTNTNSIADVRADSEDMICAYNEATATATHAYKIGDYFIYNNVLYVTTSNIAIGDTIVPDTNCTTTNIVTEVGAVQSSLTNVATEVGAIQSSLTDTWHYVVGSSTSDASWLRYKVICGVCYVEGNIGAITITTTFSQFINDNTLPTPDGKAECTGLTGVGLIPLLIEITALGGVKIAAQSTATDNYATFCLAYPIG